MKRNRSIKIYKSFEQLKSELFPKLTEEDRKRTSKWGAKQIGTCLADNAINQILHEQRKAKA